MDGYPYGLFLVGRPGDGRLVLGWDYQLGKVLSEISASSWSITWSSDVNVCVNWAKYDGLRCGTTE